MGLGLGLDWLFFLLRWSCCFLCPKGKGGLSIMEFGSRGCFHVLLCVLRAWSMGWIDGFLCGGADGVDGAKELFSLSYLT